MFDPEEAAREILGKKKDGAEEGQDSPSGMEAFKAAFDAMQAGDTQTAYDAFKAAVASCQSDMDD